MLTILFVGFLLGMRHALEADHVMAVASLVGRECSAKKAIHLGVSWGVGHTLTLLVVVIMTLLFTDGVPQQFAQILEMIVGLMLVFLGISVLHRLTRDRVHFHLHQHQKESVAHFHAHSHRNEQRHTNSNHDHDHGINWRALAVGLMHGLAGSAALVVLTVASTDSLWLGIGYAALFGIGSILGMLVLSSLIAVPLGIWGKRLSRIHQGAMVAIGLTTMMLGGNLLVSNAIATGLLAI